MMTANENKPYMQRFCLPNLIVICFLPLLRPTINKGKIIKRCFVESKTFVLCLMGILKQIASQ